jgi:hypothetical protein
LIAARRTVRPCALLSETDLTRVFAGAAFGPAARLASIPDEALWKTQK